MNTASEIESDAKRITKVEQTLRTWKAYLWVGGIVILFGTWVGLVNPFLAAREELGRLAEEQSERAEDMAALEVRIGKRRDDLAALQGRVRSAEAAADRALIKAGSLEAAVTEARDAARKSLTASEAAREASGKALAAGLRAEDASGKALAASQAAQMAGTKALAASVDAQTAAQDALQGAQVAAGASKETTSAANRAVTASQSAIKASSGAQSMVRDQDERIRGYDRLIALLGAKTRELQTLVNKVASRAAGLRTPAPAARPQRQPPRPERPKKAARIIYVNITGTGSTVYLRPGPAALDRYDVSAIDYKGEFLVPNDARCILTIDAVGVNVLVDPSLHGRVEPNITAKAVGSSIRKGRR